MRAVVLILFMACSFPAGNDPLCPPPPVVEYYSAETEEQMLPEDMVGVWYVEDVFPTETDLGVVYALFVSLTDIEYDIDTSWIIDGDGSLPVSFAEIEQHYAALAKNE